MASAIFFTIISLLFWIPMFLILIQYKKTNLSQIIGVIYISVFITAIAITGLLTYTDNLFWKENIKEFDRLQEFYSKKEIKIDVTNEKKEIKSDELPKVRNLHKVEIFYYMKVAVYEELIKFFIWLLLFYVYIKSIWNSINKYYIFTAMLFLSSFSFYLIENILYASNWIPILSMVFRTISPAHFFVFITMLFFISFSELTIIKIIYAFLLWVIIHFIFDAVLTMNYSWYGILIIFIWLIMWWMSFISYEENNKNIWQY